MGIDNNAQEDEMLSRRIRFPFAIALAAATIAAAGTATFGVLAARPTTTVVRQATVSGSPVSATTSALTVGQV